MTPDERKEAKRLAATALRAFRRSFGQEIKRPEAAKRLGVQRTDVQNWESALSLPPDHILAKLVPFGFPKELVPLGVSATEDRVGELLFRLRAYKETHDKLTQIVAEAHERWQKVEELVSH